MTDSLPSTRDRIVLQLQFQRQDGWSCSRQLHDGQTLTVGSRESCGVHLPGHTVAPIHCVLKSQDGQLWVQDWYSSSGTFVNGETIADETQVPPGATISVGDYTIETSGDVSTGPAREIADAETNTTAAEPRVLTEPTGPEDSLPGNTSLPLADTEPVEEGAKSACAALPPRSQAAERPPQTPQSAPVSESPRCDDSGFELDAFDAFPEPKFGDEFADDLEQETVELLRAEVEQLQCELAERDQELESLRAQATRDREVMETIPASEPSPALVDRMEELLEELQRSDHRIAQLEEVLRCTEEAARAEHDERHHLEAWFNDIEQRVSQRESEWKAEHEVLQQRLAEATQKTRRLEEHLRQSLAAGNVSEAHERELQRQREENDRLSRQLENAERDLQQYSARQVQADGDEFERRVQTEVDARLREEQIVMAQERAVLARQKAELVNMRGELENLGRTPSQKDCDIDARVRGFREHLREIHSEEQPDSQSRSLTQRVADLWRRLDGRG
jgi:pSer/pThr/pTyr-binding forkhead associated (FHA) protein